MRRQAASTRRDLSITLQGEIGTILDWIDRTGKSGYKPKPDTASTRLLVSAKSGTLIRAIHLKNGLPGIGKRKRRRSSNGYARQ
jgi:hypothetical protein